MLKAYETSGRVHIMAYMIDPTSKANGIRLMLFLSSWVLGHMSLDREMPCDTGNSPLLDWSMLNLFNTLSMYVLWESPSSFLDLSREIFIPRIKAASPKSFMVNFNESQAFTDWSMGMSLPRSNTSSTYRTMNVSALPLTFLYTQESSSFWMKPYSFMISSKRWF